MIPDLNGFEVCKKIREQSEVAIIIITALSQESNKIFGFNLGADDYVTKPFSIKELIARIKANLKHTNTKTNIISFGEIKIDLDRYEIFKNDKLIALTAKEFDLLKFFITHANKVFTRENLLEKVWHYEYCGDARTVDVTIRRLRSKIESTPDTPKYILTKRGVGYFFNLNQDF
jgi:two-component system response regulator VicR